MSVYFDHDEDTELDQDREQDLFDFMVSVPDPSLWLVSDQQYPGPPNQINPLAPRFAA
jgi:hypothetical protein